MLWRFIHACLGNFGTCDAALLTYLNLYVLNNTENAIFKDPRCPDFSD